MGVDSEVLGVRVRTGWTDGRTRRWGGNKQTNTLLDRHVGLVISVFVCLSVSPPSRIIGTCPLRQPEAIKGHIGLYNNYCTINDTIIARYSDYYQVKGRVEV